MIWVSSTATIVGIVMTLQGRQYDIATLHRLEEQEGPTALMGLGILCMFIGGSLGILSGLSLVG